MPAEDPREVETIVVHAEDVVTALEANRRGPAGPRTVLRVTPPFSARMRARLHEERGIAYDDPAPVHVPPETLVADPPAYPAPDDTGDALRADPDAEYTPERHHDRHARAVEEWRERVRGSIVEAVDLPISDGRHRVAVSALGAE